MKQIWDDGNLKAIGALKKIKKYYITVEVPFTAVTNEDKYYDFRSVLVRNNIPFTERIEEEICKN